MAVADERALEMRLRIEIDARLGERKMDVCCSSCRRWNEEARPFVRPAAHPAVGLFP
jgi:hypothetical protein